MKLKYCPNCRKSGKAMWRCKISFPEKFLKYSIECPSCHYCGKLMPFEWLAELSWNHEKRSKT